MDFDVFHLLQVQYLRYTKMLKVSPQLAWQFFLKKHFDRVFALPTLIFLFKPEEKLVHIEIV